MVIEGLVERKSWGDIAVDDIKVLGEVSMRDCKGEAFNIHTCSPLLCTDLKLGLFMSYYC